MLSRAKQLPKRIVRKLFRLMGQGYYAMAGSKFQCNICGHRTNLFASDTWHKFSICPRCQSEVRHRLAWAALAQVPEFHAEKILRGKTILHFAPETILRRHIQKLSGQYKTADMFTEGYDYPDINYNLDMTDMKVIGDNSIDCLIAMDVLEHIPDHRKAMREIYRVLKPGGVCVLTVPQKDHLETTEEDLTLSDPKEREARFGQFDHWRIYGSDFATMLQASGFRVSTVDETRFSPDKVVRNVLFPPALSTHPLATNYRKIYFGRK